MNIASPRRIAVIAHTGKTLGGGLDELRTLLTTAAVDELIWYEVPKSRRAPAKVRKALKADVDLIVVWGGDGMLQRCLDTMASSSRSGSSRAGRDVPVAIVPAGTANLLAHNLGIPQDLGEAVRIGLSGVHRRIDLGRVNGEHFAVMAGIGFDADMIQGADGGLKDRLGRIAYVWTGLRAVKADPVRMTVKLDRAKFEVFDGAEPDDGWLDVGVTTARGATGWAKALAQISTGPSTDAADVRIGRAKRITVRLDRPLRYELDGGARTKVARLKVTLVPAAVTICVDDPALPASPTQIT
jgi:diacylglycerol kinase (ATP)